MKDLTYYLGLNYKIEIEAIPEKEGGGYVARLAQFGKFGIIGDGENIHEALADLENAKRARFERYLKEGTSIPEPEQEEDYSGRFVVRLPKYLHKELVISAKQNGTSLNQLVCTLLASRLPSLSPGK